MKRLSAVLTAAILLYCIAYSQEKKIPSPKEHFGFNIGDDYMLATYTQTEAYFRMLASSPRVRLEDIGMTEEGRHQYMLIISSPGNIISLEKYRAISEKLARAENITDDEAKSRRNYQKGDVINYLDGDSLISGVKYNADTTNHYGYGFTTLVSDKSRVIKGGSWNDRAYWLSPGTRRFLEEDQASSTVGFRCAMDRVGSPSGNGRKTGINYQQRKQNTRKQ